MGDTEKGSTVATWILSVLLTLTFVGTLMAALAKTGSDFAQAKEILQIVTNLFGVVLGFYFGGRPAQSVARQANDRADALVKQNLKLRAAGSELAQMTGNLASRSLPAASGVSPQPTVDDLLLINRLAAQLGEGP